MHQCLCVLEAVARILKYIERKDAFRLALTCKTLLEPSLDRVWREINSFQALVACLPPDLWREEVVPTPDDLGDKITLLHLRRELKAEDLRRYLARYAPRIREFDMIFQPGMKIPSFESLQALELVTEGRPGALSPLLKKFTWYDASEAEEIVGEDIIRHLSPYMFLFLGTTVENLQAELEASAVGERILHKVSVELSLKRLGASLIKLSISGEASVNSCFANSKLLNLKHLDLYHISTAIIPRLSVLPRLQKLEMCLYSSLEFHSPHAPQPPVSTAFPSLRRVEGYTQRILDAKDFLQHLPPCNTLEALDWREWNVNSRDDLQIALDVIKKYCNPLSLSRVLLREHTLSRQEVTEKIEIEEPGQIDLSPLYVFKNMEYLRLEVSHSVLLTPDMVARIPTIWPRLRSLVLCQAFSSSHIPLIDHEHLLQLVYNLPSLCELGIQFDATRIPETVQTVRQVARLHTLRVGGSPICSPARTVAFLKSNFPFLDELDITYRVRPNEGILFVKRWDAVHDQWNAFLAET